MRATAIVANAVALACVGAAVAAAGDARLDGARKRYDPASWAASPVRDGMVLDAFRPAGFTPAAATGAFDGIVSRRYEDARGGPGFVLEMAVAPSIDAARERLLSWLAFVSSPGTRPTAASRGLSIGDAAFVGPSGAAAGRHAWIAFLRGNVAFRLTDLDPMAEPAPDLAAIATTLDRAASQAPLVLRVSTPVIRSLSLDPPSVAAGADVTIAVDVADATGTPVLDWTVGGPGQGYVEQDASGKLVLRTTGAGVIPLLLQVTGGNGSVATASVSVDVRARAAR